MKAWRFRIDRPESRCINFISRDAAGPRDAGNVNAPPQVKRIVMNNNLLFGDARRQYYEMICDSVGAGPGVDGAAAVQTDMTNTRMTDPEVLELCCPVWLLRSAAARG